MRVRPSELLTRTRRDQRTGPVRRGELRPGAPAPDRPASSPAREPQPSTPELREERRMREAGGPEDKAFYTCSCGFAFEAAVTTSVACPHCGTGQAW
ncbi:hypothetical protein [Conexibacter sp. SYSU D00693]|uniref:hypothetical protein n=1 Tax=Conexibacter sp. SYSU D00693 TaxID=2812560 RepID=UPI00196A4465|nr:hypothetical protein [Conexibacter sp. SYSU D00693]